MSLDHAGVLASIETYLGQDVQYGINRSEKYRLVLHTKHPKKPNFTCYVTALQNFMQWYSHWVIGPRYINDLNYLNEFCRELNCNAQVSKFWIDTDATSLFSETRETRLVQEASTPVSFEASSFAAFLVMYEWDIKEILDPFGRLGGVWPGS